jgi:hypothetical protein
VWSTGLSYSRGPFVGTTGAIGSTAFDRIEILGCGNKLIEIFRPFIAKDRLRAAAIPPCWQSAPLGGRRPLQAEVPYSHLA